MSGNWTIGVIGGAGMEGLAGLADAQWIPVRAQSGTPSDEVLCGTLAGVAVRFLLRHGRGHPLPTSAVDARANIEALKRAGASDILALGPVHPLSEELRPGGMVAPDQFIDCTARRGESFFGAGLAAAVDFAEPVCPRLRALLAKAIGAPTQASATYVAATGAATGAERRLYRQWGGDVLGADALPEARLAREAELPYAFLATIVPEGPPLLDREHAARAEQAVAAVIRALPPRREPSPIDRALDNALLTHPDHIDPVLRTQLGAVAGRRLAGR